MSDQHVQTIRSIYAAFGKGDVSGILSHVADSTRWDFDVTADSPVPWRRTAPGAFPRAAYERPRPTARSARGGGR